MSWVFVEERTLKVGETFPVTIVHYAHSPIGMYIYNRKTYTILLEEIRYPAYEALGYIVNFKVFCSDGAEESFSIFHTGTAYFKRVKIEVSAISYDSANFKVYRYVPDPNVFEIEKSTVPYELIGRGIEAVFVEDDGSIVSTKKVKIGLGADFLLRKHIWQVIFENYSQEVLGETTIHGITIRDIEETYELKIVKEPGVEYPVTFKTRVRMEIVNGFVEACYWGPVKRDVEIEEENIWVSLVDISTCYEAYGTYVGPKWVEISIYGSRVVNEITEELLASVAFLRSWFNPETGEQSPYFPVPIYYMLVLKVRNPSTGIETINSAWNGFVRISLPGIAKPIFAYAYANIGGTVFASPAAKVAYDEAYGRFFIEFNTEVLSVYSELPGMAKENIAYFPHEPSLRKYRNRLDPYEELYLVTTIYPDVFTTRRYTPQTIRVEAKTYTYMSSVNQGAIPGVGVEGNYKLKYDDGDLVEKVLTIETRFTPKLWTNTWKDPDWQIMLIIALDKKALTTGEYSLTDESAEAITQPLVIVGNKMGEKIEFIYFNVSVEGNLRIISVDPETGERKYVTESGWVPFTEVIENGEMKAVKLPVFIKALAPGTGKVIVHAVVATADKLGYYAFTETSAEVPAAKPSLEVCLPTTTLYPSIAITGYANIVNNTSLGIREPKLMVSCSGPIALVYGGKVLKQATIPVNPLAPGEIETLPLTIVWDGSGTGLAQLSVTLKYVFENGVEEEVTVRKYITVSDGEFVEISANVEKEFCECGYPAIVKIRLENKGTVDASNLTVTVLLWLPEISRFHKLTEFNIAEFKPGTVMEFPVHVDIQGPYEHRIVAMVRNKTIGSLEEQGYVVRGTYASASLQPPEKWIEFRIDPETPTDNEKVVAEWTLRNWTGPFEVTIPDNVVVLEAKGFPENVTITSPEPNKYRFEWGSGVSPPVRAQIIYVPKVLDPNRMAEMVVFQTNSPSGATCEYLHPVYRFSVAPAGAVEVRTDKVVANPGDIVTVYVEGYVFSSAKTFVHDSRFAVFIPPQLELVDYSGWEKTDIVDPASGQIVHYMLTKRVGRIELNKKYSASFQVKPTQEGVFTIYATFGVMVPEAGFSHEDFEEAPVRPRWRLFRTVGRVSCKLAETDTSFSIKEEFMFPEEHVGAENVLKDYDSVILKYEVVNKGKTAILSPYIEVDVPEGLGVQTDDGSTFIGPSTVKIPLEDLSPYGYPGYVRYGALTVFTHGSEGEKTITVKVKGKLPDGSSFEKTWSKTYNVIMENPDLKVNAIIPYNPSAAETEFSSRKLYYNQPGTMLVLVKNDGRGHAKPLNVKILFPSEAEIVYAEKAYPDGAVGAANIGVDSETGLPMVEASFELAEPTIKTGDKTYYEVYVTWYWKIPPEEEVDGLEKQIVVIASDGRTGVSVTRRFPIYLYRGESELIQEAQFYVPKELRWYYEIRYRKAYAATLHNPYSWFDPYTGTCWIYGMPKEYLQGRLGYSQERFFNTVSQVGVLEREAPLPDGIHDNDYF